MLEDVLKQPLQVTCVLGSGCEAARAEATETEPFVRPLVWLQGPFVPAATADLAVCTEACQKQAYLSGASRHKDPFRYLRRVKSSLYAS